MKTRKAPAAVVQQFAANEYVSACYSVYCSTPNNNAKYHFIIDDTNKNGVYDAETDLVVFNPKDYFATNKNVWGCGGYHTVQIRGSMPTANGFAIKNEGTVVAPVLWWNADTIEPDPSISGVTVDTFHVSDLTRANAIVPATDSNFS